MERNHTIQQFGIKGMTCASCSARIEKVVSALPGVQAINVNLADETAQIRFEPEKTNQRTLREAIGKLGFEAKAISSSDESFFSKQQEESLAGLRRMKQDLIPSLIFAFLLLFISMGEMAGLPLPHFLAPHAFPFRFALTQFLLLLPILWFGRKFYQIGIPNLFRGTPNMDSLIAVGTGAATIYSTWNLVEIALGVEVMKRVMDLYFESAGVLIALVSLGKYLEARSKIKTSGAIRQLMQLTPETATLIQKDGDVEKQVRIDAGEILKDDILLIRPGERISVDGTVVKGESSIDESMVTGESLPVTRKVGDPLIGGTLNKHGMLRIRADRVGKDTLLAGIIRLVRQAQGSKAPIANLADRISLYFVPAVIATAITAGLAWYFIGGAEFPFALRIFIAVLVIACPCAMGLATPTSIMVGTGRGAQLGVLIKSGAALEIAEKVNAVVFDKTGTLTYGRPAVTDFMRVSDEFDPDSLYRMAAGAESASEHPLAEAVVAAARAKGIVPVEPETFEAHPGLGISARIHNHDLLIGNRAHMLQNGVAGTEDPEIMKTAAEHSKRGKTPLYCAVNKELAALFAIADPIREETKKTIGNLKKNGIRVIMLTGDHQDTARAIAGEAGIEEVIAQVLPAEKGEKIADLQKKGFTVAMVGDGINDAPALAVADLGIAMGTGIDAAIESGDIVLMQGNLEKVLTGLELSRATMRNIRQNLFWAFAYNVIGIPVAAGVLYAFGGPTLNPMIAGAAMAMSSVSVVTNALRLRFFGR